MQIIKRALPEKHKIYLLGDIHLGTRTHHSKGFKETIKRIKSEKNSYVIIMGDLAEGRPKNHKFFDLDTADKTLALPINQYKAFTELVKPISDKIIVVLEGNHDRGLSTQVGNIIEEYVCTELGVPFGTMSSRVWVTDSKYKLQYKIYVHHGFGVVRSSAGDIVRRDANIKESIKRRLKEKAADCLGMFMGHTHGLHIVEPMRRLHMYDDGDSLRQEYSKVHQNIKFIPEDDRWYGNTGSFMKASLMGVTTYAEAAGYNPNEMGYLIIHGEGKEIKNIEKVVLG